MPTLAERLRRLGALLNYPGISGNLGTPPGHLGHPVDSFPFNVPKPTDPVVPELKPRRRKKGKSQGGSAKLKTIKPPSRYGGPTLEADEKSLYLFFNIPGAKFKYRYKVTKDVFDKVLKLAKFSTWRGLHLARGKAKAMKKLPL